jgi:anti-sigma regulatory factor (Ser/Thr protein kinase)
VTAAQEAAPLRLELPAVADSVPEARSAAVAFARAAGASERALADVALAVSEAATNVVLHAYRDRADAGTLTLEAQLREALLEIVVTDAGGGLEPRTDSPGLGMGLALMAAVATSLQIDHDGTHTRVHVTFDLSERGERLGDAPAGEPPADMTA